MNIYKICFYAILIIHLFQSITGNEKMIDQSFKALVILGLIAILNNIDNK